MGSKSVAVTAGRYVFTSIAPKDKEVFVPKPVSIYYDNLAVLGRTERRREQAQFLVDAVRRGMPPVQALVLGVYIGLREDELLGNPYDYSKIGGVLGSVACLPKVREGFGKLGEAKIRSVREAFRLAREGLVIAKSGRMSFDPDNYHQVVEEFGRLGLVKNRDLTTLGLEYTPYTMAVTPTLVLRGLTEVAQTTTVASRLYGDFRDEKIAELFGSYCTTDVITAYYQFEPSTGNRRLGQERTSSIV